MKVKELKSALDRFDGDIQVRVLDQKKVKLHEINLVIDEPKLSDNFVSITFNPDK